MANVKISALPAVSTVVPGTDVLPLVSNSGATTTKATPNDIVNATLLAPGPIGSTTKNTGAFTTIAGTGQLTLTNASNYNVYASGAGANYFAGAVGIGATPITGMNVTVQKNVTGGTSAANFYSISLFQSDVTANGVNFWASNWTAASSFTLNNMQCFRADQGTIGSGSTVTSQVGFFANNSLTGATNNYGFYSNIPSASGRYNFYAGGTAANAFVGDLTVYNSTAIPAGGAAGSGYKFSSTSNFGVFFGSGAPTLSAAKGSLYLRSDGTGVNDRMYVNTNGSTTWTAVVTVA